MTEEEKAFVEELYEKHYEFLINYAMTQVGNRILAEDLVQDTFYEAMKGCGIDKIAGSSNSIGWLVNTLKNKLRNYSRRASSVDYVEEEDFFINTLTVEGGYETRELYTVLDKIFTAHEWMLFQMYFIERHSVKEMAELEGISENNFKVRMKRLKDRIMQELGKT